MGIRDTVLKLLLVAIFVLSVLSLIACSAFSALSVAPPKGTVVSTEPILATIVNKTFYNVPGKNYGFYLVLRQGEFFGTIKVSRVEWSGRQIGETIPACLVERKNKKTTSWSSWFIEGC